MYDEQEELSLLMKLNRLEFEQDLLRKPKKTDGEYAGYDPTSGLSLIKKPDGSISFALPITNGTVQTGERVRMREGGEIHKYDAMPLAKKPSTIIPPEVSKKFRIYIEFIGINLLTENIFIQILQHLDKETRIVKELALDPELLFIRFKDLHGSNYELKEIINNSDKESISIISSDKCVNFTVNSQGIVYSKRTSEDGYKMSPVGEVREKNRDFCITNCKPFTLFSFVSQEPQANPYTKDLSYFFTNAVPPLIRKKELRKLNRNFINVWRLRDRSGSIYATGYVSDDGMLKVVFKRFGTTAFLNENFIFYTYYLYSAVMEIQIGCADIFQRQVRWYRSLTNDYFTENLAESLFRRDYLPFDNRS